MHISLHVNDVTAETAHPSDNNNNNAICNSAELLAHIVKANDYKVGTISLQQRQQKLNGYTLEFMGLSREGLSTVT